MRKSLITVIAVLTLAVFVAVGSLLAQAPAAPAKADAKKFDFVGAPKCKICHKVEYDSWLTTKHAKAWETLKPEQQKGDSCAPCHMTGKDAAGAALTGVQCESCHGPGSVYKAQTIMKDKKLALASGMIEPTKEVCVKCHNEKSPTFKGFEFEKAVKNPTGIHAKKPKAETKG